MKFEDNMALNSVDATFYVIVCDSERCLKKTLVTKMVEHMAEQIGATFYGIRAGVKVRDIQALKQEFKTTIPSQIQVITVYTKKDECSLFTTKQRDMFFKEVLECDNDADVVEIVERIDEID